MILTGIGQVDIESSWRKFTDTAKIKLPRRLWYLKDGRPTMITKPLREIVKTGDKVKIQLGYNRTLTTEFEGYVSRSVRMTFPYEIECEDEMWQLKRKKVSYSNPKATVRQILEAVAPGYEVDCADEVYGSFSMKDTTPVKVFDELRKTAGLYTFFRDKRLVCGLIYSDKKVTTAVANYAFGRNIISNDLQWLDDEDIKTIVYGSSLQNDGTVVRASIGEEGGNIVRVDLFDNKSKKQVEETIKRKYESLRVTGGYDGDLKSFGWPYVVHGQTVRIKDDVYEQRDSKHFVDEVKVAFGPSTGYKRTIRISNRA